MNNELLYSVFPSDRNSIHRRIFSHPLLYYFLSNASLSPKAIKTPPQHFCIIADNLEFLLNPLVMDEAEKARIRHQIVPVVKKVRPKIKNGTMQFTCSSQVKLRGCIAPSDTLSSQALNRGVNRYFVFVFGAVECLCGRREIIQLKESSLLEKIIYHR